MAVIGKRPAKLQALNGSGSSPTVNAIVTHWRTNLKKHALAESITPQDVKFKSIGRVYHPIFRPTTGEIVEIRSSKLEGIEIRSGKPENADMPPWAMSLPFHYNVAGARLYLGDSGDIALGTDYRITRSAIRDVGLRPESEVPSNWWSPLPQAAGSYGDPSINRLPLDPRVKAAVAQLAHTGIDLPNIFDAPDSADTPLSPEIVRHNIDFAWRLLRNPPSLSRAVIGPKVDRNVLEHVQDLGPRLYLSFALDGHLAGAHFRMPDVHGVIWGDNTWGPFKMGLPFLFEYTRRESPADRYRYFIPNGTFSRITGTTMPNRWQAEAITVLLETLQHEAESWPVMGSGPSN